MFGLFFRRKRFYTDVRQNADGVGKVMVRCSSQAQVLDCFAMSVVTMVKLLQEVTPGEFSEFPLEHFLDLLSACAREKLQAEGKGDSEDGPDTMLDEEG